MFLRWSKLAFNSRALELGATRRATSVQPIKTRKIRPSFDEQNRLNGARAIQIDTKMARKSLLIAACLGSTAFAAHKCVFAEYAASDVTQVNGMEMGEVVLHTASSESAPEATVKAVEVPPGPPPDFQGTPNPVRAEGEMI